MKKIKKKSRENNFDVKALLEESSDEEKGEVNEIKKVLKSVSRDQYEERHHQMITELRIRKMLARDNIKESTKEQLDDRKKELMELYSTFSSALKTNNY